MSTKHNPAPNPFPTPADVMRASAGPLAALAGELTKLLNNGQRRIAVPYGLAALVAMGMRAQGWAVVEQPHKEDPINAVDLVFGMPDSCTAEEEDLNAAQLKLELEVKEAEQAAAERAALRATDPGK